MNLKKAALLALLGSFLLSIMVTVDFVNTVAGVTHDVIPAMAVVRSLVYLVASIGITVFLYSFYRAQA